MRKSDGPAWLGQIWVGWSGKASGILIMTGGARPAKTCQDLGRRFQTWDNEQVGVGRGEVRERPGPGNEGPYWP